MKGRPPINDGQEWTRLGSGLAHGLPNSELGGASGQTHISSSVKAKAHYAMFRYVCAGLYPRAETRRI